MEQNNNSKGIIWGIGILIVLVGGYFFYFSQSSRQSAEEASQSAVQTSQPEFPEASNPPSNPNINPSDVPVLAPKNQEVTMTADGFSPASLTIPSGTTVLFINKDTVGHWPASGVHPTHQVCPGLDALRIVQPGESYSFKFSEAKTCPIHDHLNPSVKGSITVTQ